MRNKCISGMVVFALVMCIGQAAKSEIQYTITDLGSLEGGGSYGHGVNNNGQVTGHASIPTISFGQHAFLFSEGQMRDIGFLPYKTQNYGYAINNRGQVTGKITYPAPNVTDHAFLYSGGSSLIDLGVPDPSYSWSVGDDINDSGQITGTAYSSTLKYRAFIYSGGTMTPLGTLPGFDSTHGAGINASGQITGTLSTSYYTAPSHIFLYSNGIMSDLGTLSTGRSTIARAMNDYGQITGRGDVPTDNGEFATHAFLYTDGAFHDLGTLGGTISEGLDINNKGQVVGAGDAAFLYSDGIMKNLNDLIDPDEGWLLIRAEGINDLGQITGWGRNSEGREHAFLLTPIPEPSTISLIAGAAVSFLLRRHRYRHSSVAH